MGDLTFPDTTALAYVRDRHGLIWRVVHDGGMAATVDYSGKNWSMGIKALETQHGPLQPVPEPLTQPEAMGLYVCSQCGERPAAMVKIGTFDGWCTECLDRAADTNLDAFVRWVATDKAYNGAEYIGQVLYDNGLNGVLPEWAREWQEIQPERDSDLSTFLAEQVADIKFPGWRNFKSVESRNNILSMCEGLAQTLETALKERRA